MHSKTAAHNPNRNAPDPWEHVNRVVEESNSSFLWGMRVLPRERRRAMYAIYAFCREVDDIADEPGEIADKRRGLASWRKEIGRLYAGRPTRPTTRALLRPVRLFDLPRDEFLAVIDGMETDAAPAVRMQSLDDLLAYCRRVAVAVGVLSVHAFGVPGEPGARVARALGTAFQLTNVLRDLKEDAALARLYVPLELLAKHGVPWTASGAGPQAEPKAPAVGHSLDAVFRHPRFADVCEELVDLARAHYTEADRLIRELGSRRMRPAVVMMAVYRETLDLLQARGWARLDDRVGLPRGRKVRIALRYGLF